MTGLTRASATSDDVQPDPPDESSPTDVFSLSSDPDAPALIALREAVPDDWCIRIAQALTRRRVVLVWPNGAGVDVRCFSGGTEVQPARHEGTIASDVVNGTTVLKRIDGVYTPRALTVAMERENVGTLHTIVNSLRSRAGLIPFIGAGMSSKYGALMWGEFLAFAAESEEDKRIVAEHVKLGHYEDAAEYLDGKNSERFRALAKDRLDVPVSEGEVRKGPLSLLPLLTNGPVITTNFDRVIESFYRAAGRPFEAHNLIVDPRREGGRVVDAIQQNALALIKLHGDIQQPDTFTFTAREYQLSYGSKDGKRGVLTELGNVVYTNRPLLFLGCSLETDQTLNVLRQAVEQNPYLRSFAVLAAKELVSVSDRRRNELKQHGIVPLWFAPGCFSQIESLLESLLKLYSTEEVPESERKRQPGKSARASFPISALSSGPRPELPPNGPKQEHLDEVASWVAQRRIVFFLGSRVSGSELLGNRFYEELATRLGVPQADRNRADVVEHAAKGATSEELAHAIEELLEVYVRGPQHTHRFIASLAAQWASPEGVEPVVVATTNYDDLLERSFESARIPYHWLSYQPEGKYAGRFVHRSPSGCLRVIHNPECVLSLEEPGAVVVKMNGGLDPRGELASRFVVGPRDYVVLAARLPDVLPTIIREYLKRPLLFLGHGLAEEDVREFARYAYLQRRDVPSWAVQLRARDAEYWKRSRGVDILEADLDAYLLGLSHTLLEKFHVTT